MSKPWNALSAAERNALETSFVARHAAQLLLEDDAEPPAGRDFDGVTRGRQVSFAGLYAALHGGGSMPPELADELRTDASLREEFALLLRRTARQHLPRAAAAADREGLHRREAGGVVLRVVASRAGGEQVYLLVELPEEERASTGAPADTGSDPRTEADAGTSAPDGPTASGADAGRDPARAGDRDTTPDPPAAGSGPAWIVVRTAPGEFLKRGLPPPDARTVRLLTTADDPLVRAVCEPESEIFLL